LARVIAVSFPNAGFRSRFLASPFGDTTVGIIAFFDDERLRERCITDSTVHCNAAIFSNFFSKRYSHDVK